MSTEHTPGPWRVGKASGAVVSDSPDGLTLAGTTEANSSREGVTEFYGGNLICESATPANARLIAAAPDLLKAGEAALRAMREMHAAGAVLDRGAFDALSAATAKARAAQDQVRSEP